MAFFCTSGRLRRLQITYNFLNLPELIQKGAASLDITYDASGRKWKQIGPNGVKEYINGIEYVDGTTESYTNQDGRVVPVIDNGSTTYRSEYFIKDHLGNVRVSFADLNNNGRWTAAAAIGLGIPASLIGFIYDY